MNRSAAILACALLFAIPAIVTFTQAHKPAPPHELLASVVTPNPVVPVGNEIKITLVTSSIRREQCEVEIRRTFSRVAAAEGEYPWEEIVFDTVLLGGRVRATGKLVEFVENMTLPADKFPPGNYAVSGYALNDCQDGRYFVVKAKRAYFTVASREGRLGISRTD
jgi:hypothetical protein